VLNSTSLQKCNESCANVPACDGHKEARIATRQYVSEDPCGT
jgi:hypothetical protein